MKANYKLALAMIAGVVIGAAGITVLYAQGTAPSKVAPAYVIAEIDVIDAAVYKTYIDRATPIVNSFGGRFIVRGGKTAPFAGEPPKRVAVYVFDSMEKAQAYRDSAAYKEIIPIRDKSSKFRAIIAEGLAP